MKFETAKIDGIRIRFAARRTEICAEVGDA
jgi:hypothetical protein